MKTFFTKLRGLSATRIIKRLLRMVAWLLGGALLLVAIAFAVFTWGILPRLDHYRPDLERLLSENTGYQVQIQSLSGRWSGLVRVWLYTLAVVMVGNDPASGDGCTASSHLAMKPEVIVISHWPTVHHAAHGGG